MTVWLKHLLYLTNWSTRLILVERKYKFTVGTLMLSPEEIEYCPLYCEENIWHLCQHSVFADKQTYALFISNPAKRCAMWNQRSSTNDMYPVVWDYHVILLAKTDSWRVFDLDSRLPMGVELDVYLCQSFSPPIDSNAQLINVTSEFNPCFKLVCGKTYAEQFSSDRKHMCDEAGSWLSPPPLWPLITGSEAMSLQHLTDMTCSDVLTLSTLKSTLVDLL